MLYGLCALTAGYFIYKKLNSKKIEQKGPEGSDFESFKKSIEKITAEPNTTVPNTTTQASGVSGVSTKTVELEVATKMTVFKKILSIMQTLIHVMRSIFNLEDIFPSKGSRTLMS